MSMVQKNEKDEYAASFSGKDNSTSLSMCFRIRANAAAPPAMTLAS